MNRSRCAVRCSQENVQSVEIPVIGFENQELTDSPVHGQAPPWDSTLDPCHGEQLIGDSSEHHEIQLIARKTYHHVAREQLLTRQHNPDFV